MRTGWLKVTSSCTKAAVVVKLTTLTVSELELPCKPSRCSREVAVVDPVVVQEVRPR